MNNVSAILLGNVGLKGKACALLIAALFFASSCAPAPEPIAYGKDVCVFCKMLITEQQYGAVLVTRKGKNHKFDSVECLAAIVLQKTIPSDDIHSMWTVSFDAPGTLIAVEDAIYLHSPNLRSPMGLNVSSYRTRSFAKEMRERYGGAVIGWQEVLQLVEVEWLPQWGGL
jgi:copper chaperone NosL